MPNNANEQRLQTRCVHSNTVLSVKVCCVITFLACCQGGFEACYLRSLSGVRRAAGRQPLYRAALRGGRLRVVAAGAHLITLA